ncbi:hypothetical protein D515_03730 [Grimontia indica]|uniref:Uncharacterized protein n=1 Tax=Grimontia indica TaxID=1056512 RepID=R1IA35_9GAMM|nr:hypothetical protein D515_03730 [Grimontia indica]
MGYLLPLTESGFDVFLEALSANPECYVLALLSTELIKTVGYFYKKITTNVG